MVDLFDVVQDWGVYFTVLCLATQWSLRINLKIRILISILILRERLPLHKRLELAGHGEGRLFVAMIMLVVMRCSPPLFVKLVFCILSREFALQFDFLWHQDSEVVLSFYSPPARCMCARTVEDRDLEGAGLSHWVQGSRHLFKWTHTWSTGGPAVTLPGWLVGFETCLLLVEVLTMDGLATNPLSSYWASSPFCWILSSLSFSAPPFAAHLGTLVKYLPEYQRGRLTLFAL